MDEDYREKEQYCLDILAVLEKLGAGECTIKGLLQFELYESREALKKSTDAKVSEIIITTSLLTLTS